MSKISLITAACGVVVLFIGTAIGGYLVGQRIAPSLASEISASEDTASVQPSSITAAPTTEHDLLSNAHIGVNFLIFPSSTIRATPRAISATDTAADLATLHAEVSRQLTNGDALWNSVESREDVWNWTTTDAAIDALTKTGEPIVDLFAMQYASPNAPWKLSGTFEKTMTPEAETYIRTVVRRYKDRVTYWEIGNEMDHWRAADPGSVTPKNLSADSKLPKLLPTDGYSPEEQGAFFAAAAAIIREEDPNAVMVMPGMSAADSYQTGTWLPGFVQGAGTDAFDVVNYHDYKSWDGMQSRLAALQTEMQTLGISEKSLWLTETGSTADATLTQRTNYPNSTTSQAADVIRRVLVVLSNSVNVAIWHTYFSSPSENGTNAWRAYGLRNENGDHYPSYDAYTALGESFPATSVTNISTTPGTYIMKITPVSGNTAYAVWGSGAWTIPDGITSEYTISSTSVSKSTAPAAGATVSLSAIPLLFR